MASCRCYSSSLEGLSSGTTAKTQTSASADNIFKSKNIALLL